MHGVAGAYAKRIFVDELGASESSLLNCVPKVTISSMSQVEHVVWVSINYHLCSYRKTLEVVIQTLT